MNTADKILDGYDKYNNAKDIVDKAQTANDLRKELSNGKPLTPESGGALIGLIGPMIPGAGGIDGDDFAKWGENAARNISPRDRVDAVVDAAVNGSSSQGKFHYVDPLILDLNGNGIETTGLENGVQFELNSSGLKVKTGWVSANDGLLVWDRNNDGKINDASELFGNHVLMNDGSISEHGFAALKDLDFNNDDTVDINDEAFKGLRVWKDINQDGVSQENELFTLNELEINSLSVSYIDSEIKFENGNIISQIGSFNKTDGSSYVMGDVNFAIDITQTSRESINFEQIDFSNLFLLGLGRVSDLQTAISISNELKVVVEEYKCQTSISYRENLLEKIIFEWAKTDPYYSENINLVGQSILTASEGVAIRRTSGNIVLQDVVSLEELPVETQQKFQEIKPFIAALSSFTGSNISTLYFNGRDRSGGSAEAVIDKFYEAFNILKAVLFQELYPQTFFLEQFGDDIYFLENNKIFLDIPNIFNTINDLFLVDQSDGFKSLLLLLNHIDRYGVDFEIINLNYLEMLFEHYVTSTDGGKINQWFEELSQYGYIDFTLLTGTDSNDNLQNTNIVNAKNYIFSGDGDDQLTGNNHTDKIFGGEGNDTIYGRNGDDYLDGGSGNDKLYGGNGEDTLIGGTGSDYLEGGSQGDTYIFSKGHGQDIVYDYSGGAAGDDTIKFTDVKFEEVKFIKEGADLKLFGYSEGDSITIKDFFKTNSAIEKFAFSDQLITSKDFLKVGLEIVGGNGVDLLQGNEGNDILIGNGGNDTLNGGASSDTVIFKILQGFESDITAGNGVDTWIDFNLNQGDKIDVSNLLIGEVDKLKLNQFISYEKNGTSITLSLDRDGNGTDYQSSKLLVLNNQSSINSLDDLIKADAFVI
ncbi:calcium-binding protein [Acinetobacter bouvetii]|uniref:calcium-binding protein n=1 Tax=Acinetobacter bouvetii TaxID=202951 RepID=UPI00073D559A|nr:calcium-binding protein [Acinetobacter bouvetii]